MTVIGVIGCGRISGVHFPSLCALDNVRIKYACDLILSKAQAAKDKYKKIDKVTTNYREVLADPEVKAVFVLTPNYAHYTVSMDALRAGKHVFCEKPITVSYALSCEMAEEAKKQNRLLNIGVCNRYHKSVELLREAYLRGDFGNVYHVYCSFRDFRSIPGLGGAFTTKSQSGGGVLIDWGVHFFDLIYYILDGFKLRTLSCDAYNGTAKNMKDYKYKSMWAEDTADIENGTDDVEDFITGYIRTDKASISFNGAWAQNVPETEMFVDILGDKGGARLSYGGKFVYCSAKTLESSTPEYEINTATEYNVAEMYYKEDKAFIESIETGVKNRNYIDNVLESAKLLDRLYVSAGEKKEVEA